MKRLMLSIAVGVSVVALVFGANTAYVNSMVKPINVPIASQDIPPHTQITEEMIKMVQLPTKGIPPEAIKSKEELIGKWSQVDYGIPKNSYFYKGKVVSEEELLDAERMKLKDGERLYTFTVDIEKSAAGNIIPGVLVDIWYIGRTPDNEQIVGRLFRDVLVIGAKNRKAEDILEKQTQTDEKNKENRELYPTVIQLAVNDEQIPYLDLARATGAIQLIPKSGAVVTMDIKNRPDNAKFQSKDEYDIKAYLEMLSANLKKDEQVKEEE